MGGEEGHGKLDYLAQVVLGLGQENHVIGEQDDGNPDPRAQGKAYGKIEIH